MDRELRNLIAFLKPYNANNPKKAWKKFALKMHPDKHLPENKERAAEFFKMVTNAYQRKLKNMETYPVNMTAAAARNAAARNATGLRGYKTKINIFGKLPKIHVRQPTARKLNAATEALLYQFRNKGT